MMNNPRLVPIAREAKQRLQAALDPMTASPRSSE